MGHPDSREVVLTLCLADGTVLGDTDALTVPSPWWPDMDALVTVAREALGVRVVVLRLLSVERRDPGAADCVRYLAEVDAAVPGLLPPAADVSVDEPLRMPWARPGGPTRQLNWARDRLAGAGMRLTGEPVQMRSWNISSLWRLPTGGGDVWLKAVPPFFAHEGAIIEHLSTHPVPRLLARGDGIVLMSGLSGDDLHEATLAQRMQMIDLLVGIQREFLGETDELQALGLPDWRLPALAAPAIHTIEATPLSRDERAAVDALVAGLDRLEASVRECGIADTLVHGDFHSGNVRDTGSGLVLLDWGDSGIGHPMLDEAAFTQRVAESEVGEVRRHWADAWAAAVPGSDAARAARLLAPAGALRQAIIYQGFLDSVEPDERVYHRDDVGVWLRRAAALVDQS